MSFIDPALRGWRSPCPRCKVDRHDRCIGALDCGCPHEAHPWNGRAEDADIRLVETGVIEHAWGGPMGEGTHYYDDGCLEHSGDNVPVEHRIAAERGEEPSRALPADPGRIEAQEAAPGALEQLTIEGGAEPYPHHVRGFTYTGDDAEKVTISATVPMALKAATILTAQLQQRATGAVIHRALEHYLLCHKIAGACPHVNDEVA